MLTLSAASSDWTAAELCWSRRSATACARPLAEVPRAVCQLYPAAAHPRARSGYLAMFPDTRFDISGVFLLAVAQTVTLWQMLL